MSRTTRRRHVPRTRGRTVLTGAGLATALTLSGAAAASASPALDPAETDVVSVVMSVDQPDGSSTRVTWLTGRGSGVRLAHEVGVVEPL